MFQIKANLKNAFDDPSIVKPPDSEADQKNFFRKKESGRAPRRPNTKVLEAVKGKNLLTLMFILNLVFYFYPAKVNSRGGIPEARVRGTFSNQSQLFFSEN